jgi:hypothetical protein
LNGLVDDNMRLIQTVLFSFFLVFNLEASPSLHFLTEAAEELMQQSKSLRLEPHLREDEELLRQTLLLEQLIKNVPDYGDHESLEQALDLLLRKEMNLVDFILVNSKTTEFCGRSRDEVFFVQDAEGVTLYVAKAFIEPGSIKGRFFPELSAMALLRDREMKTFKGVNPLIVGKCHWKGKNYGLLVEIVAPGIRMDKCVEKIAANPKYSIDRKLEMEKAIHLCECFGQSIAELHEVHENLSTGLSKDALKRIRRKVEKLFDERVKSFLEGKIDVNALTSLVDRLYREAIASPFVPCYQHGDLNLNNVFFDESSGLITAIDVHRMHRSIDINGNPLSDGVYDLIHIKESLIHHLLGYLTDEEISLLIDAIFRKDLNLERFFNEPLVLFYTVCIRLAKMIACVNFNELHIKKERRRLIFERHLQYLKMILD